MAIIQNWLPPSRENWELLTSLWQLFPLFAAIQWFVDWYPQGKTSTDSRWNLPGKWAWFAMEIPGAATLLYIMYSQPKELNLAEPLPWGNWAMAGMFTVHYAYRAVLAPLVLNPSMSPISPFIWFFATVWQLCNAVSIGGWLAGHGPRAAADWAGRGPYVAQVGMVVWGWGLLANVYHDDDLREIRRAAARRQRREAEKEKEGGKAGEGGRAGGSVDKVYMLPQNGLFRWVLYAHYLCEWVEWCGFWMVGGWGCVPARNFVVNEIATMLPRAVQGKRWYIEKFGADKVGNRKAAIPGIL